MLQLSSSAPLIILDRDGVINFDSDNYIKNPDEWQAIPGSLESIARLTHAGWAVAVATNQSGIERGLFDISTLHAIHNKMVQAVAEAGGRIDGIFFCPHTNSSNCQCRKPAPGLMRDIATRYSRELKGVPTVGDSLRDLQAGAAVQCDLWLVRTGKGERTLKAAAQEPDKALPAGVRIAADLAEVVTHLLKAQDRQGH
ncbi:MAG: D-glycero-beta-D-manno-heptose 1,7-bisphosphate 7-phosphatase [Burkholderiaceae bacterium]|nr:D-glycero-beta-D-manno-heptose 1,7-bisphosphate 7-phosphatase [Burkholderiaceae bacterium]